MLVAVRTLILPTPLTGCPPLSLLKRLGAYVIVPALGEGADKCAVGSKMTTGLVASILLKPITRRAPNQYSTVAVGRSAPYARRALTPPSATAEPDANKKLHPPLA